MNKFSLIVILSFICLQLNGQILKEEFSFEYEGFLINGVLNVTAYQEAKGLVLIIHGSGQTDAVANNWHLDVRETIISAGYSVYMWDKMGCGKSKGIFDYNQSIESSSNEVISAIKELKRKKVRGSEKIGLWGISRAGWINPVVIQKYKDIAFWISVSGVDEKENFGYLLQENLRISGLPKDSIELVVEEWKEGNRICHSGGSYEEYLQATPHYRKNSFVRRFMNGEGSESGYYNFQTGFMNQTFDSKTKLQVYVDNFEQTLSGVRCPVLALFGEKDMNVDWKKTKTLYQRILGPNIELSIKSFPDGNHNLFKCNNGGFYEFQDDKLPWERSEGFLETIKEWLNKV